MRLPLILSWLITGCAPLWVAEDELCPEGRVHLYEDLDEDGFGDRAHALGCEVPGDALWSTDATDCDDQDPKANPASPEIPGDAIDQDCDGIDAEESGDTKGGETYTGGGGCGCGSEGGATGLVSALALLALGRRRRG